MKPRRFLVALAIGVLLLAALPLACAEQTGKTLSLPLDGKWMSIFPSSSEFKITDDISIVDPNTVKFTLNEGIVSHHFSHRIHSLDEHCKAREIRDSIH